MTTMTNVHRLPRSIVAAVTNDPYVGGGDISVTKLIDSPQILQLTKRHSDKITTDVSERVWSLLGQAVHTVLERAGIRAKSGMVEDRLYAKIFGWEVSGQFDTIEDKTLIDYKVTRTYKAGGSDSWTAQLNVLRWLAFKNDIEIEKLEVIAILRDWRKSQALRDSNYPQAPILSVAIPLWSIEDTEMYVAERVALHQFASSGHTVKCTDEERWAMPTKYALTKAGGKRALRVADSPEELGVPADGYSIVERKGEFRRCERYCDVSAFCQQKLEEAPATDEGAYAAT